MIHSFLRSIGFKETKTNEQLHELIEKVLNDPDEKIYDLDADGNNIACYVKYIDSEMGLCIVGNIADGNQFRMEYYYPFFKGSFLSTKEPVEVERFAGRNAYAGICDELKLGVTLIFYINNVMDMVREKKTSAKYIQAGTVLSALACEGKILLPVMKPKKPELVPDRGTPSRETLIRQAKDGNPEAIENLTLGDMDTYSMITRRIANEDVLSIVDTSLIPYGIESDQYVIIGEIINYFLSKNPISGENVWILSVLCNNIKFDVCINEDDLYGEPQIGRRFRGTVWLQGHVNPGY